MNDELYLLPDELEIDATRSVEKLKRGIYEVPVYSAARANDGPFRACPT